MRSDTVDYKELCFRLIQSETEDEIVDLLKEQNLWTDLEENWRSYGDNDNNWSVANNQMGTAAGALVELLVNAGDANLISKCRESGIDPKDWSKTPKTVDDAVEQFFNISKIKFFEMSGRERTELAEKTCGLVVTGSKTNPSYGIYDFGEGQEPKNFPVTFVSLQSGNKHSIQFVQGKFNQGSTGVLGYCGKHGFKLIVSRRNPRLNESLDSKWGFTLVRRIRPDERKGTKSSKAVYLCPKGEVPSFDADGIPVIPGKYPDAYGMKLSQGTYGKLYSFNIGPGLRSQAQFDLHYKLSALLPKPMLPIRIFERRANYSANSYEATLSGLLVRLGDVEQPPRFPLSGQFKTKLGEFSYTIFLLPEGAEKANYTGNDGIVYTVNGQSQTTLSRSFFKKNAVGMGYLADSLIVLLDCSKLSYVSHEELFQTSRDRAKNTTDTKEIEKKLEEVISSNQILKEMNNLRRKALIDKAGQDEQLTHSIFEKIIKVSPSLTKMLVQGNQLKAPFAPQGSGEKVLPELKEFPTYFSSKKRFGWQNPKRCPLGTTIKLSFYTDAANDYLGRVSNPGTIKISFNDGKGFQWNHLWSPNNGLWTLTLDVPSVSTETNVFPVKIELDDVSRSEPLVEYIYVQCIENEGSRQAIKNPDPTSRPPTKPQQPGLNAQPPRINEIYKEKWGEDGIDFDDGSGMCVVQADQGYDFFVNMDNKFLLTELKEANVADSTLLKARFKFGLYFLALSFINPTLRKNASNTNDQSPEDLVRIVTAHASMMILPLVEVLSQIDKDNL